MSVTSTTESDLEQAVTSLSLDEVTFHLRYPKTEGGVVLISSDKVAFGVEDFYLKASSPVFREMFSLPTKGGPIGLPETSVQLRMLLDKLTDSVDDEKHNSFAFAADFIAAITLARRFQFNGAVVLLKDDLFKKLDRGMNRCEAPAILAFACQSKPVDRRLAKNALSLFEDCMPMDLSVYRSFISNKKKGLASPGIDNLRLGFLESLGITGAIAYTQTLNLCQEEGKHHWPSWDWPSIPDTFVFCLDKLEK